MLNMESINDEIKEYRIRISLVEYKNSKQFFILKEFGSTENYFRELVVYSLI